jgi:hypothetical protein
MNNLKNTDFILINKIIISNITLFTYEELIIILYLHTGPKSISSIRTAFSLGQSKFQKTMSFLENNNFIEKINEIVSLGENANLSSLLKRENKSIGSLDLGNKEATGSLFLPVSSCQSFASSIPMPAKCREVSYLIFERLGWDTSRPFDRMINIGSWIKECRQLLAIADNDTRLIRDAIDILKEKEYLITSPRSLLKTTASLKNGVSFNAKQSNKDDSNPDVF